MNTRIPPPRRKLPDRYRAAPRRVDLGGAGGQGGPVRQEEVRHGVALSNLDQPLFDGAEATKRC
ncbi:hypothetical protein LTT66_34845 [Nocardia gipuzkoensis]|uniref:hypothetical protein n=1 Tax=Nocardia gipuzkoensis TaxID=2749991 RepID=UPI001E575A91|nr:hypothetical protein [Nocardia gipuzkoensis]UGT68272.1 hypothetical protein LTT66_34845 [Nocardia gipuzkoensis]